MHRKIRLLLFIVITGWIGAIPISAQVQIERISITERGDGNGYVIRYHLNQMAQSYEVRQPELNEIQMQLLSVQLDTAGAELPSPNAEITDIEIVKLRNGIGVRIRTAEGVFFRADSYPDQNMRDLLLSLEYMDEGDAEDLVQGSVPFQWAVQNEEERPQAGAEEPEKGEVIEQPEIVEKGDRAEVAARPKQGWTVRFGATGGVSSSNVSGASYSSNPRREVVFGVTALVETPLQLPYGIETGIRAGVLMMKKGFRQPSEIFNTRTVALDYIDIPVTFSVSYPLNRFVRPVASLGFYTSFKAGAEAIDADGTRNDLDESVRVVNAGWIGGIGTDLSYKGVGLTFQIMASGSVTPVFKNQVSGSETHTLLTGLVTFWF